MVAADNDVAKDDFWESACQSAPDDETAEKAGAAAHIFEFAVHAGGCFAEAIAVDEHGQTGQGTAVCFDGDGIIESEFLVFPLRITLGEVVGSEGHTTPPFLSGIQ